MNNTSNHHRPLAISTAILVATSCIYLGFNASIVHAKTIQDKTTKLPSLTPGVHSAEVQVIQVQLKALGYYDGTINGNYDPATQNAVAKFQTALGLKRQDGIIDQTTRITLYKVLDGRLKMSPTTNNTNIKDTSSAVLAPTAAESKTTEQKTTESKTTEQKKDDQYVFWWRLLSLSALGALAVSLYISYQEKKNKSTVTETIQPTPNQQRLLTPIPINAPSHTSDIVPSTEMSLMPKVNVADELMENLKSLDPAKQRSAIWNLSQKGDSRAIEPLLQLLGSADSQQHSLILSALADITIRNLKPIRKALVMSVQNENSEVRQNAIRDLTRIHDVMSQINQALYISLSDEDTQVQATAKYALKQINGLPESHYPENVASEERMDVLTRY